MRKKQAFTLAEILISLTVIAVLSAILIGSLSGVQPDRPKIMFKKAYQITERVVGELVNDETIYPYDEDNFGFYNTEAASVDGTNTSFEGATKFCNFFARKLNVITDIPANGFTQSPCVFQTSDSISWIVPSDFTANNGQVTITVDINGSAEHDGKNPNSNDNNNPDRDVYNIIVHYDGRVSVPIGGRENEYLRSHSSTRNNNN